MVGPFIFFDQMGPAEFRLGAGMDVRPRPRIGISTVTYLFEGEIIHRDSLGTVLPIRPGELNWMTAGCGIAHSERTSPELRSVGSKLFGIQSWLALATEDEETLPDFVHYEASELPELSGEGKLIRVIAGSVLGASSPVRTSSPMFYVDVRLSLGASLPLDPEYEERAIYTVVGEVEIAGDVFCPAQLLVFRPGDRIRGQIGLEGYFTVNHLADVMQLRGYIPADLEAACAWLLRHQLIESDQMSVERSTGLRRYRIPSAV